MISIQKELCVGCGSCARSCPMGVILFKDGQPRVLPDRKCISCMHCVASCPKLAVTYDGIEPQTIEKPENQTEALVMSRRSVRHFKSEPPEKELIQWALDRSMYSPSGKNVHHNRWTVLYGLDQTDLATDMALEYCMKHKEEAPELIVLKVRGVNLVTCGAPCVIIGWSPEDTLNPVVDTAVAMATVELLLQSRGVSTCWGGYLTQITNKSDKLQELLGIPEGAKMRCALMVGYADKESYPHIPYRPKAEVIWRG